MERQDLIDSPKMNKFMEMACQKAQKPGFHFQKYSIIFWLVKKHLLIQYSIGKDGV